MINLYFDEEWEKENYTECCKWLKENLGKSFNLVNSKSYIQSKIDFLNSNRKWTDQIEYCDSNCGIIFSFRNISDAVCFKLIWNGYYLEE
jgi:hypothetical protein